MNIETKKRIISEKKTIFPSLRREKTIKTESEKINELVTLIPTNNITELNKLIYTGTKSSLY